LSHPHATVRKPALWLAVTLLCAGCNQYPESYPPPEQREPLSAEEVGGEKTFVAANDPYAESFFIRDVRGLEAGQWRWTGAEPTFHFVLEKVENLKFVMGFSVAGATLKDTGPVTLKFFVNDRLLGEQLCEEFGDKRFEKAVDPSWLEANADTLVKVTIDPPWVSPADGTKLGIILTEAGFVEQ
jgi:hypothetical protein